MPRWLIAVFTLHFLLSLGASAFGMAPAAQRSPQTHTRSIQTCLVLQHLATPQTQKSDAREQAVTDTLECSLADASQDLPDDQNIRLFEASPGRVLFRCPMAIAQAPAAPRLKKQPKRPRQDGTPRSA
ncbi:MAG: hypothetical protein JSS01_16555 [Proteobacteria bacterium]|nr:hypothetical protein [Pseudomonadota bacterium]